MSPNSSSVLVVPQRAVQAMKAHCLEGYPHEVCGLLLGRTAERTAERLREGNLGRVREVVEVWPAANLERGRSQDRYVLDPKDYLRAEARAHERHLEILGVYHSHPDHPSRPSETDRLRAAEVWDSLTSWSYVILAVVSGDVPAWHSWVLRDRAFHAEEVRVISGPEEVQ